MQKHDATLRTLGGRIERPRRRILRRLAGRLGLALAAVAVAAAVLEIGIRISGIADYLYTGPAYTMSARGNYWTNRAGWIGMVKGPTKVRIGPLGSRLHGSSAGVPTKGRVTVAVFGDSFTFGQGVDDSLTFPARLEQSLRDAQLQVDVLNFGVIGHTLEMELAHMEDVLPTMHPRVVVWAILSMDMDVQRTQNRVDRFGYLTKTVFGRPSYWGDTFRFLLRHSYLALVVKEAFLRLREAHAAAAAPTGVSNSALQVLVGRFRAAVARFERLTAGVQRVVMCVDLADTPLAERMRDVMAAEFPGVPFVYAPPAFARIPARLMEVPRDGHPNAAAHSIYAGLLLPAVADRVRATLRATR